MFRRSISQVIHSRLNKQVLDNAMESSNAVLRAFKEDKSQLDQHYATVENHVNFELGNQSPIQEELTMDRFRRFVKPMLMEKARQLQIFGDQVPEQEPKGHLLTEPPAIAIHDCPEGLYTILLSDLDHPVLETSTYEEFCHWLVTNVPVKGLTKLTPDMGTTVKSYVPALPVLQNPSRVHRYVVSLLRQKQPLDLQLGEPQSLENRLDILPLQKFINQHNLEWVGFGFYTTKWNEKTPEIFKSVFMNQCLEDQRVVPFLRNTHRAERLKTNKYEYK
ncbi:phosphatidylethanolamine-binding protein [Gorgonomyces haynaldii]|nr:phosphatidylethanolamine-binding protein [Gorgonomyces haynaldii]